MTLPARFVANSRTWPYNKG